MLRIVLGLVLALGPLVVRAEVGVGGKTPTLSTFEEPLAAHGEWLESPRYGTVWRPSVMAPGWRPYFNGRWLWTDDGWYWDSEEPWGWATYHYGRWAMDPQYGWVWAPAFEWAPAWVEWRVGERVIGWAPLAPRIETLRPVMDYWIFVPTRSFANMLVSKVELSPAGLRANWAASLPASGLRTGATARDPETPAYGGPPRAFVEYRLGAALEATRLLEVASPAAIAKARGTAVYRPGYRPVVRPEQRVRPVAREEEYEE